MATRQDIQAIVIYMQGLYPNYHPNLDGNFNAIDAMLDALGDIDTDSLRLAVKAACTPGTGRQFAPSADEIRAALVNLNIKASGVPQPGEAWQEVMDTIRRAGCHGGTPEFSHPLVKKAVQAIGYEAIGMSEDVMVERAHFLKIYAQYLERAKEDTAMIPDAQNYIEARRQISDGVKLLADKWSMK